MSDMSDMSTTCQDMGCRLLRGGGVTCPGISWDPLEAIADAVHASGRRLLIDAMSSFGVLPLHATMPFEALTASSNKGLQGSPGLGFCICREAALDSAAGNADSLMASDGSMIAL